MDMLNEDWTRSGAGALTAPPRGEGESPMSIDPNREHNLPEVGQAYSSGTSRLCQVPRTFLRLAGDTVCSAILGTLGDS